MTSLTERLFLPFPSTLEQRLSTGLHAFAARAFCARVPPVGKQRLDTLLAERGLFASRTRAAASVMAGEVRVGRGERRAAKPGEMVDAEEIIAVEQRREYASRGGVKLANALDSSGVSPKGRRALDIGASTGGFTDCLLQRGARHVTSVDVGYGLLDFSLRNDPRVTVLERTNARELTPELLAPAHAGVEDEAHRTSGDAPLPDLAVLDVSFISLTKVLAPVIGCLARDWEMLAMVKPQFEVGRARVGKGGVVRDAADRRAALIAVGECALGLGAAVRGYHSSGLPGPKGNLETFIHLTRRAAEDEGSREQLEAMAREVEP